MSLYFFQHFILSFLISYGVNWIFAEKKQRSGLNGKMLFTNFFGHLRCRYFHLSAFVFFFSVSTTTCFANISTQIKYLVSAPAILRSGVDQTITVRLIQHNQPVVVNATIIDWREQKIITSAVTTVHDFGILKLQVPQGHRGKAILQVCGNCHSYSGNRFQNSTVITIVDKGSSAFIQTDKPIYKPSQRVFINIFTVNRDLRPVSEAVTAYVKAPNDVKIVEWKNLRPKCCGSINISFPLSDQPPMGEWKIYVELQNNRFHETFEVKKYVLPKFDVHIEPPLSFRDLSICEEAVVTAKYTFGKPVTGRLLVNMTIAGVGYSRSFRKGEIAIKNISFSGQARFSVCLQDNLGRNHVLNHHFTGNLEISATVISEDGSSVSAFDDTTIVSRYLVEIEFTRNTRRHFKPGIPFDGQLFVRYLNGTPAGNILVQLRVEDQRGIYLTQDILSRSDGLVLFTIPAPEESTKFIWLAARVVAINGVNTGQHYLSVYHGLHSWHSPSNCNLLIDNVDRELEVGKRTEFIIKSSCPCDFGLNYELMSRGEILHTGVLGVNQTSSEKDKRSVQGSSGNSAGSTLLYSQAHIMGIMDLPRSPCRISFPLTPTANMAPWSKLLMYYVRSDGEGVADSIQFPVKLKLENKVNIKALERTAAPGQLVNITVQSNGDSCVCLGMVDKSVHLMKPGYMLSHDDIADELLTYDMDNLPYGEENVWHGTGRQRSRRSAHSDHHIMRGRDSFYAFLETGLVTMTNFVKLDHKPSTQVYSEFRRRQALQMQVPNRVPKRKRRRVRSYFPETWYWQCFDMGSSEEKTMTLRLPDSVTSWVANAVSMNHQDGIGLSEPTEVQVLKKFFLDFSLPYSATRGEQLEIPLSVYNYMASCVEVRLAVLVPNGVAVDGTTRRKLIRHFCANPESSRVIKFNATFSELGSSKLVAAADAIVGSRKCCRGDNKISSHFIATNNSEIDHSIFRGNIIAKDALVRTIMVESEGEPREYTHSVFFCPKERVNITTHSSRYHFVKLGEKEMFSFRVRAKSTVHITLTKSESLSSGAWDLVIGGNENTRSWISKNSVELQSVETSNILSEEEFRAFWIRWSDGHLSVGYGIEPAASSIFLNQPMVVEPDANYIGLTTIDKEPATFHLWSKDESRDNFRDFFQLDVPKNAISDSIIRVATVIGDVMGPTLENLNNLLQLPHGCGEQNMINFAPNIYILSYLKGTNQLTAAIESRAIEFLVEGYQRQLTYKRLNGSYSAFGDRDQFGSMWLTAFVMKTYAAAREFIYIDNAEIQHAMEWILSQQLEDGSFPAVGRIMNKDAGINKEISLTAYVTIALMETKLTNVENYEESIRKAITFLENSFYGYQDSYTVALTAYALTLGGSGTANEARSILFDKSSTSMEGSYRHWSLRSAAPSYNDPEFSFNAFDSSFKQTVASAEVEVASYALLAYAKTRNVSVCLEVVRWISQQRNSRGGFSSTQDTCMALQALSYYATISYIGGVNLNITLEGPNNFVLDFHLNNRNSEILQKSVMPALGKKNIPLFVNSTGDGCALLQINIRYNVPDLTGKKVFDVKITMDPTTPPPSAGTGMKSYQVTACMRWLHEGSTNMAVLEYNLLTGFDVDKESLEKGKSNQTKSLKRYDVEKSKVIFYFDEISSLCRTCVNFKVYQKFQVANIAKQRAKVYDYYEPGFETMVYYHPTIKIIPENHDDENLPTIEHLADDLYPECQCYKECGNVGPPVCGSDGEVYSNLCRMNMAACEKKISIEQQEECIPTTEAELPNLEIPPITDVSDGDYTLFPFDYHVGGEGVEYYY